MTTIPENTPTQADLEAWYKLQAELTRLKAAEILLRSKIFKGYFPAPVEGTNSHALADGWVLKGVHKINRSVDPGALGAMRPKFTEAGIKADELIKYTPELVIKEYRTLTEEQRKLFDQCLIVKPGSPSLEIVLPAQKGKK